MTTYYADNEEKLRQQRAREERANSDKGMLEQMREYHGFVVGARTQLSEELWSSPIRDLMTTKSGLLSSKIISGMSVSPAGSTFYSLVQLMHRFLTKTDRDVDRDITPRQFAESFLTD